MRFVLPVIVVSQFFCTSLWFAGNSIIADIAKDLNLDQHFLAHLTSVIQFGFILGTLVFAVFTISDRFSPSLVFCSSAILAGFFNLGISINSIGSTEILLFRFLTGFFLAGIYPVGMKIASDYYQKGLGKSLGFLIGALVIGTAFPHLLKNIIIGYPWEYIVYITTVLSIIGGLAILLFVPDGPYRKPVQKIKLTQFMKGFKNHNFRSVSIGYFGHMWELYTFWAFVPVMVSSYNTRYPEINLNVSLLSFFIIASGAIACVFSGILSQYFGEKKIASLSLFLSCLCCIVSPFFLFSSSIAQFIIFLFIWSLVVIADSPLFSTLVVQNAPEESKGTSLVIVNCIGFAITIISIQFINLFSDKINEQYIYMLLAIGPILGLIALLQNKTIPIARVS
ncbi:MFS transporter [Flavobacterium soyangense]|uniref:MFS transporter n=1 Tax=Flavobacterium soyangense TaxID=2023265 RepID=A0A930XUZ0_9FLAO|nr:MFS transporter [Flavobacterium soyangense]MBF2709095.1 MFS transporter [Flavobacterium soyangense]